LLACKLSQNNVKLHRTSIPLTTGKNMVLLSRKFVSSIIVTTTMFVSTLVLGASLDVIGWGPTSHIKAKKEPPTWLGDDPILGRLACPAILRLEGDQLKNDALLLKVNPSVEKVGSGERWTLTLRPGLRWWSGFPIDASSLSNWLKTALPQAVTERLSAAFPADVTFSVAGPLAVRIDFPKAPNFGPYVLSGISLMRPTPDEGFECAGLYSMNVMPYGVDLVLNKGYTAKYDTIKVYGSSTALGTSSAGIKFSMANQASKASATAIETKQCVNRIDIPLFTTLIWNPSSPLSSSALLRQGLTMATPRGEILRTAAGDIGSLVSAPILRSHPGYNSKTLIRPYNLEAASQIFEQAGYKQAHIGLPRAKTADKPVSIQIARMSGRQDLVEKIISDSFASLGIETHFDDISNKNEKFDAVMAGIFIPMLSQDLRSVAHTSAIKTGGKNGLSFPFEYQGDKKLDELLDDYSVSLTRDNADFGLLRKVHERWFEVEPWTVVMAHQYCVESKGLNVPKKLNTRDADWFRRLTVD